MTAENSRPAALKACIVFTEKHQSLCNNGCSCKLATTIVVAGQLPITLFCHWEAPGHLRHAFTECLQSIMSRPLLQSHAAVLLWLLLWMPCNSAETLGQVFEISRGSGQQFGTNLTSILVTAPTQSKQLHRAIAPKLGGEGRGGACYC